MAFDDVTILMTLAINIMMLANSVTGVYSLPGVIVMSSRYSEAHCTKLCPLPAPPR